MGFSFLFLKDRFFFFFFFFVGLSDGGGVWCG